MQDIILYVFSSIILLIFLLHFINFKVIIKYDKVLLITFKILFFKYTFIPIKEEIDLSNIFSLSGIISELDDIKGIVEFIFSQNKHIRHAYKDFISHLKYELIFLDARISAENASKTAISFAIARSFIFYLTEYLSLNAALKITNESKINILPCYLNQPSYIKFKISSKISIASFILFWLKMGIKLLKQSILSLIKNLESIYGRKQAKRNDKNGS